MRILALCLSTVLLPALEVELRAPLCTLVPAEGQLAGDRVLRAELVVPEDAPADLGVGVFVRDRDGGWFQRALPGRLTPGRHRLEVPLRGDQPLTALPLPTDWRADDAAHCDRTGLFFWSAQPSRAVLRIARLDVAAEPPAAAPAARLVDLAVDGMRVDGRAHGVAGGRWTARVLPVPFPANPYDPAEFALDAVIEAPDGTHRIPCAWVVPMRGRDRGDGEEVVAAGPGRFELRWRPTRPGRHRVRLEAAWNGGAPQRYDLPDLEVAGPPCDPFVRVDRGDPRFFAVDGAWHWPVGLNLHSTYDKRSRDALKTRLTPARGSLVYEALLARLAAGGGDACEIWMSSWNLALEWRADWPGYRGLGRYNQENAWRLDRVLDLAWNHGVRVNLVLNNHGQASAKSDREWKDNPYNTALGGPVADAALWFTDPAALALQARVRRYLVARWADHPAVLGWKLFSEVNLTAGRGEPLVRWHEQAARALHALDAYGHPVTTHWSGDYKQPNPDICALPEIDYLCIDAYRGGGRDNRGVWRPVAPLMEASTGDPLRGLARFGKPLLVTEYGGSWNTSPEPLRDADLRSGPWAALVSGHAGAPMCWWWEWVDQSGRWAPYAAIRAFIADEDLRGAEARPVSLAVQAPAARPALWAAGWLRPGRLLGYLVDPVWGAGGQAEPVAGATVVAAQDAAAGDVVWEWWDCDRGVVTSAGVLEHRGGRLTLPVPTFRAHCALKLRRADDGSR